jgi:chromosome segregation ATPase
MIPKIIHYCWFGGNGLPAEYHSYIAGWQTLHPEWKVIRWDESNAPVTEPYLANALRLTNWSNCSNYIRLWALQQQGGVYMDTDFKLLKPLDTLLSEQCFLGFEQEPSGDAGFIINNAIMGALPGHAFIEACFRELTTTFDASEQSDLSGPGLTTKMLQSQWGLKEYGLVRLPDITIYPTEYFYPIHVHNAYLLNNYREHISPETYGIHMWGRSWIGKKELMEIVDYLNFRIGNQEKYIAQLEASTQEANKKSEEIFYWKTFFEDEYNRVKKLADAAGTAAAGLDRQTLELISQKLDDQHERSASLENLATQQSKALQTLKQELEERLAILERLEELDGLKNLDKLDGLSAQLRQSAEAGKERGERLSALEEALRQLAENGTRVQSALEQQSSATEAFRHDLAKYRETLSAFGEAADEQREQLRGELQQQLEEHQLRWQDHQTQVNKQLKEYQESLAEHIAGYQTRLAERLDQHQSRLDEQLSQQRADAEQRTSATSEEIRDLKKNITQLEETVSGLSDIAQLLLKKELENEQLRQSHDRNRSEMEELARRNMELARLLEEKEKNETGLKNTIDEMRNTLPYKLLHKAFRKKN